MTFQDLLLKHNRLEAAIAECKRLSRHGTGHSVEAAGMELYEAQEDYRNAIDSAPIEVKNQMAEHLKMLETTAA